MSWKITDSFPALKHRNFQLFVPGQFISLIGFWMQSVGLSWLVYRMTHSPAYLGAINFTQQIPILLFGLVAGSIVDRVNRRHLVIWTQTAALVQAALLALLTYTGHITLPTLFLMSAFLGVISALDLPARQAFLIEMVTREGLMSGIALNSSLFNAARMIGPAVAGFVVHEWGESVCFFMNAVSYLAVIVALLAMRIERHDLPGTGHGWQTDLADGFRYIRKTRPIRILLQLIAGLSILGFPFTVLLPVFADRVFERGADGYGLLMTAAGIGALGGALFLAVRKGVRGIGRIISKSALGFSLALVFFSYSPYFWLAFALLIAVGFFMMLTIASVNTTIQSIVPDELRGRVMSFFTTSLIGLAPIGGFVAGGVAKYWGVQNTILTSSLLCLAGAYWFYRSLPSIRSETRRLLLLQQPLLFTKE
jgi:MFS family permease